MRLAVAVLLLALVFACMDGAGAKLQSASTGEVSVESTETLSLESTEAFFKA